MNKIPRNKKDLSPKEREELLRVLKARFEKNTNRHQDLEWAKVQAKLEASTENCGHSMKWKEPAVNRMLLNVTKGLANTFFTIVQRKVPKAAEVFVMTVRRWSPGKKINQKIALLTWQLPWASNF